MPFALTDDAAIKIGTIIIGVSIAAAVVAATGLVSAFCCWRRLRSRETAERSAHSTGDAVVTERTAVTERYNPKVDQEPQLVTTEESTSELYGNESTGTLPPDETSESNF